MIRQTLRGLWEMGRVLGPIVLAGAPLITGLVLLSFPGAPTLAGALLLTAWAVAATLVTAYCAGVA